MPRILYYFVKNSIMANINITLIIGTRPNFIKAFPIYKLLKENNNISTQIIHTNQHYDENMSKIFSDLMNLDDIIYLDISCNKSSNEQLAMIMLELEKEFEKNRPTIVLIFGDVTSTLAAALTCNKMRIKTIHIESGNRSFDKSMPEEINRIITDNLSDYLFVAEPNGLSNLERENISTPAIYVGNTMLDTIEIFSGEIMQSKFYKSLNLESHEYIVITLHRPSNVDNTDNLRFFVQLLTDIYRHYGTKIVFPIHPRRKKGIIDEFNRTDYDKDRIILLEPQGYIEFMNLISNCSFVMTDSGGIQEETTYLFVPCITLRQNTERPITCSHGTNQLVTKLDKQLVYEAIDNILFLKNMKNTEEIKFWDGNAASRCVKEIYKILGIF